MKKTFVFDKAHPMETTSAHLEPKTSETIYLTFDKEGNTTISSVYALRGAAAIVHHLTSAIFGSHSSPDNVYVRWIDSSNLTIDLKIDSLEKLTGFSGVKAAFQDFCERLEKLRQFSVLPAGKFRHEDWIRQQPVGGIERTRRAFKLASALHRHHASLRVGRIALPLPEINFSTTRVLAEERRTFGRPVDLKLDQKSGQIQIPLDQKKTRNVFFRCCDSAVFSEIVASLQQGSFVYRPIIDLLSEEQCQLHSIEVLAVSPVLENGNLDFTHSH